jgi:tryptophan-rich sensory protein
MDLYILLILFILLSSISYNCNINKTTGDIVKFRPPSFIFSIVWPIIFILLYLASQEDAENDNIYYVLVGSFFVWPIAYGCGANKTLGNYSILISLTLVFYLQNEKSNKYLSFVQGWLLFALILNCIEVQYS